MGPKEVWVEKFTSEQKITTKRLETFMKLKDFPNQIKTIDAIYTSPLKILLPKMDQHTKLNQLASEIAVQNP